MAGISKKPMCKYGSKCYRKNPDHLREFDHPDSNTECSPQFKDNSEKEHVSQPDQPAKKKMRLDDYFHSQNKTKRKEEETSDMKCSTSKRLEETLDEEISNPVQIGDRSSMIKCAPSKEPEKEIKEKFLVEMPSDFYEFWQFAKSIDRTHPAEAFVSSLGLRLVGPYDLLSGNRPTPSCYLCHYRYFYDPPEFQTVVAGDEKTQFHIGYFRDDPKELPVFLASNEAKETCLIKPCGPNMFATINDFIAKKRKTNKSDTLTSLQARLTSWADSHEISLQIRSEAMKKRGKKVVSKTFHGAGLVVPVDENEVGYRTLSETPGELKKILASIAASRTPAERDANTDPLTDIVTNVQFANDEGDYGTGVELGLDIFSSGDTSLHSLVLTLLPMGYRLLGRDAFAQIITAHLADRSQSLRSSELVMHR